MEIIVIWIDTPFMELLWTGKKAWPGTEILGDNLKFLNNVTLQMDNSMV